MKRTDILKTQLINSRGRFFTAKYKTQVGAMMQMNFKVSKVLEVSSRLIRAEVYIPSVKTTQAMVFNLGKTGDLEYLAADKTRISMSGKGLV
jgi:hypothetical protein